VIRPHTHSHLLTHGSCVDEPPHNLEEGKGKAHADDKPSGVGSLDEKDSPVEHEEVHRA